RREPGGSAGASPADLGGPKRAKHDWGEGGPRREPGGAAGASPADLGGPKRAKHDWGEGGPRREPGGAAGASPADLKDPWIEIKGARGHNLKSITARIPLGRMTCVTGVSGSGKSSLIVDTLLPEAARRLNRATSWGLEHDAILNLERCDRVVAVDQSPIGRSPRSNPATYTGVFTELRNLYAQTNEARVRGYGPARFSFNVKGGRCEHCHGEGLRRIEMHFLPDVWVTCRVCQGQRYDRETLAITYR